MPGGVITLVWMDTKGTLLNDFANDGVGAAGRS